MLRMLLVLAALTGTCATTSHAAPDPVIALVASSTRDAVEEIASVFTAETGVPVKVSPGASNALAQQIINGAPADVFISASDEWMEAVERENLVEDSCPLLGNRLVLIAWHRSSLSIKLPKDLLANEVKHVALAGESVPAGRYAEQALRFHGVFDSLAETGRIVRGQDVRTAMTYVARGEAEAGIVYATDARVTEQVSVAYTFNEESHDAITYPVALLKPAATEGDAEGRQFYDYLQSEAAGKIFEKHGFSHPATAPVPSTQPAAPQAR